MRQSHEQRFKKAFLNFFLPKTKRNTKCPIMPKKEGMSIELLSSLTAQADHTFRPQCANIFSFYFVMKYNNNNKHDQLSP